MAWIPWKPEPKARRRVRFDGSSVLLLGGLAEHAGIHAGDRFEVQIENEQRLVGLWLSGSGPVAAAAIKKAGGITLKGLAAAVRVVCDLDRPREIEYSIGREGFALILEPVPQRREVGDRVEDVLQMPDPVIEPEPTPTPIVPASPVEVIEAQRGSKADSEAAASPAPVAAPKATAPPVVAIAAPAKRIGPPLTPWKLPLPSATCILIAQDLARGRTKADVLVNFGITSETFYQIEQAVRTLASNLQGRKGVAYDEKLAAYSERWAAREAMSRDLAA